jgi:hypothetical protein
VEEKTSLLPLVRVKPGDFKMLQPNALLKDLHETYSDDKGYLHIKVIEESAF